jgi:hypothetical protein
MKPDSDEYYCFQWCGRMRWACIRNMTRRECKCVLARSLGRIVPGRVEIWGGINMEAHVWGRQGSDPTKRSCHKRESNLPTYLCGFLPHRRALHASLEERFCHLSEYGANCVDLQETVYC